MTPSSSVFPSFGTLLRAAWEGFRMRFWRLVLLVLVFNVVMLVIQVGVFGTVAWQAFLDYLTAGGATSLGVVPLSGAQYGASLWIVMPVAAVTLVLQLWFLASLVSLITVDGSEVPASFRTLLARGWRALPQTFVVAAALFLFVRIFYFIMVLATNLIYRYVGLTDGAVAMTNRLFLLLFALALIGAAVIAGFAFFPTAEDVRRPLRALRAAFQSFWRAPWEIGWRTGAMILLVYVIDQLVVQLTFAAIPVNPQAILSLLYLPFLLFFLHALRMRLPSKE